MESYAYLSEIEIKAIILNFLRKRFKEGKLNLNDIDFIDSHEINEHLQTEFIDVTCRIRTGNWEKFENMRRKIKDNDKTN